MTGHQGLCFVLFFLKHLSPQNERLSIEGGKGKGNAILTGIAFRGELRIIVINALLKNKGKKEHETRLNLDSA